MIVKYKLIQMKHELFVEYDNSLNMISNHDNYNDITPSEAEKYCEYHNKLKKLSVDDYKSNVDIMSEIYKETISEDGILRLIRKFPKQKNGMFKTGKQVIIAKSLNAILDGKRYRSNTLVAYAKNRSTLQIKYIDYCFAF